MKKPPKPFRRKKGRSYVGNWFVTPYTTDADQKPINLGTKNANKAGERAREYASTGKRNFQDDLDGAAESTIAAVEGAATPIPTGAPPIQQPAPTGTPPAPAAAPVSDVRVPVAGAGAHNPEQPGSTPGPATTPAQAPPPEPAADWREDAKAAAEESAKAADADADAARADAMAMSPEELDGLYKTAASLIVEGQIWAQAWIAKRRTGEAPPPFAQIVGVVKRAQPKMGELLEKQPELAVGMWTKQMKIWVPLDMLPLWAGATISVASLMPVQIAAAAGIAAEKKRAKNGSPVAAPAAPPAPRPIPDAEIIENGAGAEAL